METPENLLTVFSAQIEERDGAPVIELPERELSLGELDVGGTYRLAVLSPHATGEREVDVVPTRDRQRSTTPTEPPVEVGDQCEVEIEDYGEQGDGIARVDRGYIIFVPDTAIGDRVTVEITKALENFGFGDVVEEEPITG